MCLLLWESLDSYFLQAALRRQAASIPELIAVMRRAREANASAELETAAHKLKSHAATFGAGKVTDVALRAEQVAQSTDLTKIIELIEQLEQEHAAIEPTINRLLNDMENG